MTLDANIVIKYLDGDQAIISAIQQWRRMEVTIFLPAVAESEVLSFSQFSPVEITKTEIFLEENFTFIPFDRQIARIAADIRRKTKIKFPDAAIAATALYTRTPLVTRNQQDFKKIPDLQVITI